MTAGAEGRSFEAAQARCLLYLNLYTILQQNGICSGLRLIVRVAQRLVCEGPVRDLWGETSMLIVRPVECTEET